MGPEVEDYGSATSNPKLYTQTPIVFVSQVTLMIMYDVTPIWTFSMIKKFSVSFLLCTT